MTTTTAATAMTTTTAATDCPAASPRPCAARRRVVITGMGIVSCLGNTLDDVSARLRAARGGIVQMDAWRARGLCSQVAGVASVAGEPAFARRHERFMGETARFACHAAKKAIDDAGLPPAALRSPMAGAVIGSGTGALSAYDDAMVVVNRRGIERAPPYVIAQTMSSTASANVAQAFGLEGMAWSPSSACTTSALAIGQALRLIQSGQQDLVLAGGSEELHDNTALMFDAMGALSRHANDDPARASQPYDVHRTGFVLASGAGVVLLEALDHARARGARIYAELTGFGQCTDGADMLAPRAASIARALRAALNEAREADERAHDGRGAHEARAAHGAHAVRAMRAVHGAHDGHAPPPDYVNTHAPSTPRGDMEELQALISVFGRANLPPFSSTKGLSGHPPGACGAHEIIYTLLMMRDGYIAGSPIDAPEPGLAALPLVCAARRARIRTAVSVSFGFGGSCASLALRSWA